MFPVPFGKRLRDITNKYNNKTSMDLITEIFDRELVNQSKEMIARAESGHTDHILFTDRYVPVQVMRKHSTIQSPCHIMEEYVKTVKTRNDLTMFFDPTKFTPQDDMGKYGAYHCRIGVKW